MQLDVGKIVEGKVTGVTKFGAFVNLGEGKTGMVHISEVSNSYVSDIRQFLTEGQDVKVQVLAVEGTKINLSMKRLEPKAPRTPGKPARQPAPEPAPKTADQIFEEKLKQFMAESGSKISSIKEYADHRTRSRRR